MIRSEEVMTKVYQMITYQLNDDMETGMMGIMGHNIYKFKREDLNMINNYLEDHKELYTKCFNESDLAQTIISDLLAAGYLTWDDGDNRKKVVSI